MPHRPVYPPFMYSGGQWPLQLGPYAHYAPPYSLGYSQYQPHFGGPAYGIPSPRQKKDKRRHSLTPPAVIQLHALLGGRYRPTAVWDVSQDLPAARYHSSRGAMDKIPEALLREPATEPPLQRMRIVSDFSWDINIALPRGEAVTVGHILGAIYGTLQEPLEKADWDVETPNVKRYIHRARCARLAKGEASFKVDAQVKKVDALGEKTYFRGLTPVGPPEEPVEWLLNLVSQPKPARR